MDKIITTLIYERSTKNKHLYADPNPNGGGTLGSVYLLRSDLPETPPLHITVTIEAVAP